MPPVDNLTPHSESHEQFVALSSGGRDKAEPFTLKDFYCALRRF